MTSVKDFLLGADPEIWIYDNKKQQIISADGLFPGTKENPFPVTHGAVQVDGMAAEYNIIPAKNESQFVFNNLSVMRDLRNIIQHHNPDLDFDFRFEPVADFGAEYIAAQSEQAKRLGCTPDFNAWNEGRENPTPDADMPFRTTSGHIHIGWTKDMDVTDQEHIDACIMMTKQMDCAIGMYMPQLEGKAGKRRRDLYGRAGAFRPKTYGVEYRTPSDVWLKNTAVMKKIFSQSRAAFENLLGGGAYYDMMPWTNMYARGGNGEVVSIEDIINSGDPKKIVEYQQDKFFDSYYNVGEEVSLKNIDILVARWDSGSYVKNENVLVPAPVRAEHIEGFEGVGDQGLFIQAGHNDLNQADPVPFIPDEAWLERMVQAERRARRAGRG